MKVTKIEYVENECSCSRKCGLRQQTRSFKYNFRRSKDPNIFEFLLPDAPRNNMLHILAIRTVFAYFNKMFCNFILVNDS